MKKSLLLIAALFSAVVANADITQTWSNAPTPWSAEEATNVPDGITTVFNNHKGDDTNHTIHMATTNVKKETAGDATVSFTWNGGSHMLVILGVDLLNSNGDVVKSHYEMKTTGGSRNTETYTLSGIEAGQYVLRYFVCNKSLDHEITNTSGDISVVGLDRGLTEAEMEALIEVANSAYSETSLGYPTESATTRTTLYEKMTTANNNKTSLQAFEELQAALDAFYAETNVVLPESGKAYTIKAWWKNKQWPMTWSSTMYKPVNGGTAAVFVCQEIDGKYIFVSDNGYYLGWEADGKTGSTSDTYADGQQFTVEKASTGSNVSGLQTKDFFGLFSLKSNNLTTINGDHYLMYNSSNDTYANGQPGSKYYSDGAHTVYFTLEEYEGYTTNTFSVKSTSEFNETYVATYFAPYATTLPTGYAAYKATSTDGTNVSLVQLEGDIPANTAVLVTGPAQETVTVGLSTANPTAPTDNLLFGYASQTPVTSNEGIYALANGTDGIAFYHYTGANYLAGKAYLNAAGAGARSLVFDFGTETAIESIQGAENAANAVVYDLAGRRVNGAQKGLYIVNGKKVIK